MDPFRIERRWPGCTASLCALLSILSMPACGRKRLTAGGEGAPPDGGGGMTAGNHAPVASAGADQIVPEDRTVTLDAGGSVDPEGHGLSYAWTQTGGVRVMLSGADRVRATFVAPPAQGILTFSLAVSNRTATSTASTKVTVTAPAAGSVLPGRFAKHPFQRFSQTVAGNHLRVVGQTGYVIGQDLTIFDASDPSNLTVIASLPIEDIPVALDVVGTFVYLTHQHQVEHPHVGGMDIIDVSEPRAPKRVSTYDVTDPAGGLRVVGNRAYLTKQRSGLEVVDVGDPTAPTLLGTCALPADGVALQVSGSHVYVAAGASGLFIVDASDPAAPTLVGAQHASGNATGVDVSGTHAYVSNRLDVNSPASFSGLQIIDVGVPTAPALVGSLPTYDAWAVRVLGSNLYLADGAGGVLVIDVANPGAPRIVGSYTLQQTGVDLWVADSLAYVAEYGAGLAIVDVGQPTLPPQLGSIETPGDALSVAVAGNLAYVADGSAGLQVVDVSDLTSPSLGASYDTPGRAGAVKVVGDAVYVVDAGDREGLLGGLRVLSLGAGTVKPYWLASFDASTPDWSPKFQVVGHYVYLVSDGLKIIDLDALSPTLVGGIGANQFTWAPYLSDLTPVVGDEIMAVGDGFELIDVKNVAAPALVSRFEVPSLQGSNSISTTVSAITLAGSTAYLVGDYFTALDVSDRAAPVVLGRCEIPSGASNLQVAGTSAYVSSSSYGLSVVDISNPAAPALTAAYGTRGFVWDAQVVGTHAFIAAYDAGLQITELQTLQLTPDLEQVPPGSTQRYTVSWPAAGAAKVVCEPTAGACAVTQIDSTLRQAALTWTLPLVAGTYSLNVAVGNWNYFVSARDDVLVQ